MEGEMNKKTVPRLPPKSPTSRNGGETAAPRKTEPTTGNPAVAGSSRDPKNVEDKKLKRVLASREYSQKYRLRQLQYIIQLEAQVDYLKAEIETMVPRIKTMQCQNSLIRANNGSMKQKLSELTDEVTCQKVEYEELKMEREALKQKYMYQQKQKQLNNQNMKFPFGSP